jgi:hypothetical protein
MARPQGCQVASHKVENCSDELELVVAQPQAKAYRTSSNDALYTLQGVCCLESDGRPTVFGQRSSVSRY